MTVRTPRPSARLGAGISALLATVAALVLIGNRQPLAPPPPPWFARLPEGDPSHFFSPPLPMRKVRQEDQTRNAILASSNVVLRQTLTPQAGTFLQIAFATVCPPPHRCVGGVRFKAEGVAGSTRASFVQTHIAADRTPSHWHVRTVDLRRFRDQATTIELSVEPYGRRDGTGHPPVGVWGEPLLISEPAQPQPNVILISLDTLRADRLGSYGYERQTSPTLDSLAADGARFTQAMSQSPWTTPSHMSLFTSLYPTAHRVNQAWGFLTRSMQPGRVRRRALAIDIITLPEVLRAHGYRTLALTGGATMTGVFGFAQGFDVYRESSAKLNRNVSAMLSEWLNTFGGKPFFLFFHTFEVHAPYTHLTYAAPLLSETQRAEIRALVGSFDRQDWVNLDRDFVAYLRAQGLFRREVTEALYDGGIRAADDFLETFFRTLRQRKLFDNTLIIVFSDHGEEFGEHHPSRIYGAHGTAMYDTMLRVPLLLRFPGRIPPGTVVTQQVELIDVAPTVLDLLGIGTPGAMQGTSLRALIDGATTERKNWAMSEATSRGAELKALRTPEFKYIMVGDAPDDDRSGVPHRIKRELLFDLRSDPGETFPINDTARRGAMRTQLEELLSAAPSMTGDDGDAPLDDDVHERLRALGYIP